MNIFLWLYNNDQERILTLLKEYGDYLVERFLWSYQDIFKHKDKERDMLMPTSPIRETKELVLKIIAEKLEREKDARKRMSTENHSQGIFNILTGEVVKPRNGTYYIDDFR